jgi:anti-sigma factor ChrR (cupin superfamily)
VNYHKIPALVDAVEAAMCARYGARIAPLATAWLRALMGDTEPGALAPGVA